MKIVMLSPYFYPHTGGTEKYVRDVSAVLVQKGHEVTVITNNLPRAKNAPREETLPEGIKVIRLDAIDLFYYLPVSSQFNLQMLEGYDIVHAHVPSFSFLRSVAGKIKQPLIVTYHCDMTVSEKYFGVPVPQFLVPSVENASNFYAKQFLPKADAIITTTETYAASSPVMKDFPHHAVPIGIFHDKIDEIQKKLNLTPDKKNKKQILFLGRLAGNKGCDYLVKAMPKILAKFPDTKLIICGDGEEKAHILDLVTQFDIGRSITFLGTATFERLIELYYTSLIYIFPSINRLEAFGIVQLEAMSNYTAVVASDIPGPNAVMENGKSGLLVQKQNPDALADAVNSLLGDPEKALAMGRRGRELVEQKYNWGAIGDRIIDIYKEALNKKR
ncbi:MAG: group 1 glycosyl transferase [Candidatus Saganbacteria bacterium]|uniref:Group 1 glycosyl transferase n=1 Tax=Candidatus Saganbacteria bacterium TaxID=2575572 RepID=A0A833NX90_UNCSA|nr:MAG: group 1 glycosyl transferase [Candidatus Saganbacteria bacterium]